MLHLKPLKIKKNPSQVVIMDQRGVKGFGAEEGAPGETMAQKIFSKYKLEWEKLRDNVATTS